MRGPALHLSTLFLRSAEEPARWGEAGPALEEALRAVYERGRGCWPGIALPAEDLVRGLARRLAQAADGAGVDLAASLGALHCGDLYLASACERGIPEALAAFEETVLSQVPLFLTRLKLGPGDVDEVRQVLRETLLVGHDPKIRRYAGTGKLASFVRTAAVRGGLRLLHGRNERLLPLEHLGEALPQLAGGDPELGLMREQYKEAIEQALTDAARAVSEQQRELLHLHHVGGLSTRRMAVLFNTNQSTIVRWLQAASERILEETRRLMTERHQVTPAALASLLQLMQSQLDLSMGRLFGKQAPGEGQGPAR